MEILRPPIVRVGNRCYRKNPVLQRDVNTAEEDEVTGKYYHSNLWNAKVYHYCFVLASSTALIMKRYFPEKGSFYSSIWNIWVIKAVWLISSLDPIISCTFKS